MIIKELKNYERIINKYHTMTNFPLELFRKEARALAIEVLAQRKGIAKSIVFLRCEKSEFESLTNQIYSELTMTI